MIFCRYLYCYFTYLPPYFVFIHLLLPKDLPFPISPIGSLLSCSYPSSSSHLHLYLPVSLEKASTFPTSLIRPLVLYYSLLHCSCYPLSWQWSRFTSLVSVFTTGDVFPPEDLGLWERFMRSSNDENHGAFVFLGLSHLTQHDLLELHPFTSKAFVFLYSWIVFHSV